MGETTIESGVSFGANEDLERIVSRLRRTGTLVEVAVLQGDSAAELPGAATARGADLIVMSTHRRSGVGRLLHGSVADAVIRFARVPVILIPPNVSVVWPIDRPPRILVSLDGSQLSEAVLAPAVELATQLDAELLLANVAPWPPIVYGDPIELMTYDPEEQLAEARDYLAEVAGRLRTNGVKVAGMRTLAKGPLRRSLAWR
jgi:nucleotide-binding universal stress UspA family protein